MRKPISGESLARPAERPPRNDGGSGGCGAQGLAWRPSWVGPFLPVKPPFKWCLFKESGGWVAAVLACQARPNASSTSSNSSKWCPRSGHPRRAKRAVFQSMNEAGPLRFVHWPFQTPAGRVDDMLASESRPTPGHDPRARAGANDRFGSALRESAAGP